MLIRVRVNHRIDPTRTLLYTMDRGCSELPTIQRNKHCWLVQHANGSWEVLAFDAPRPEDALHWLPAWPSGSGDIVTGTITHTDNQAWLVDVNSLIGDGFEIFSSWVKLHPKRR